MSCSISPLQSILLPPPRISFFSFCSPLFSRPYSICSSLCSKRFTGARFPFFRFQFPLATFGSGLFFVSCFSFKDAGLSFSSVPVGRLGRCSFFPLAIASSVVLLVNDVRFGWTTCFFCPFLGGTLAGAFLINLIDLVLYLLAAMKISIVKAAPGLKECRPLPLRKQLTLPSNVWRPGTRPIPNR